MTADPDYLWLMPECCADLEGRHWSVADDFDCDNGIKSTKYIRADLKAPVTSELLEAAKAILEFVEGQQCYERSPEGYPEGPADDYTHASAHLTMKLRRAIKSTEGK